jgi:uncharacterized protein
MGAVANNMRDLTYLQTVTTPVLYAQKVLDRDHDGLLSLSEANKNPVFSTLVGNLTLLLNTPTTATNGTKYQLNPIYNTNRDAYISINNELKPKLVAQFKSLTVVTPNKKSTNISGCPIRLKSQYALEPNLNIIGNVPPSTSVLIQQGQNDSQTPVQQAFLLQHTTDRCKTSRSYLDYVPKSRTRILSLIRMEDGSGTNTAICFSRSLFVACCSFWNYGAT